MAIAFLTIPLLINVAAVWQWRGGYRYGAIIPLPFLLLAFAVDVNIAVQGGNLAGLFTIFATPPALLVLLVLAVAQTFAGPGTAKPQSLPKHLSWMALAVLVIIAGGFVVYALLPGN